MVSLCLMDLCPDPLCGSSETEIFNDEVICKMCQTVYPIFTYDTEGLAIARNKQDEVRSQKRIPSPIQTLIDRDNQRKNKKSNAHHEGLIYLKKYPEDLNGLLKQAEKIFNKGVKAQSKKVQTLNERSKMFMPSGKSNSSLFASFASLLYAHRVLTDNWNEHLSTYSNYIQLKHKPYKNHQKMAISAIKSDLSDSYSKLRILVPPRRRRLNNQKTKTIELKVEIGKIVTKFIDYSKISADSLTLLETIEYKIEQTIYSQELEDIIPNSGLALVASEILWKVLSLSEEKISRYKLSQILFDSEKRSSDKQAVVNEIISIIEMEKEFKK